MAWVTHDFECICGHVFTELYQRSERKDVLCAECGGGELTQLLCAPAIASFSIMDTDGRRQHLLERSAKHTQGLIDKEPEKFKDGVGIARRTKKVQVGYGD